MFFFEKPTCFFKKVVLFAYGDWLLTFLFVYFLSINIAYYTFKIYNSIRKKGLRNTFKALAFALINYSICWILLVEEARELYPAKTGMAEL